jgi:hypothetical protein
MEHSVQDTGFSRRTVLKAGTAAAAVTALPFAAPSVFRGGGSPVPAVAGGAGRLRYRRPAGPQIGPDGRALSFAIDAFDRMDAQRRPWVVPAAD